MNQRMKLSAVIMSVFLFGFLQTGNISAHETDEALTSQESLSTQKTGTNSSEWVPPARIKQVALGFGNPFILFTQQCIDRCEAEYQSCRGEAMGVPRQGAAVAFYRNCLGARRMCQLSCDREHQVQ